MRNKTFNTLQRITEFMEIAMALIVMVVIVIAIVFHVPDIITFCNAGGGMEEFTKILGTFFSIVIGIEFVRMLCKPDSENVLETIIFLVARHMIISDTRPIDDLLSTISIVLLIATRVGIKYLKKTKPDKDKEEII